MLSFEQIKELVELVANKKLQVFEVERSGFRLRIDGHHQAPTVTAPAPVASAPVVLDAAPAPVAPAPAPAAAPAPAEPDAEPAEDTVPDGSTVQNSPIVGTFYRSPSPDAAPFVEEGQRVKKGQVLCIVEAMKLMNEIESEENGVLVKIYPDNKEPVEFGQPLFAIKAD